MKWRELWLTFALLTSSLPGLQAAAAGEEYLDRPLRIAYNEDWNPYSYMGADRKAHGILVDVLEEALVRRMGLKVEHYGYPWNRVQLHILQGTQDAFITVPTPERLVYSASSEEIAFVVEMRAFVSPTSPQYPSLLKVRQIREFANFRVCDIYGNGWAKRLYEANQIPVTWFRTNQIAMEQVQHGNCDLTMGAIDVGLKIIHDLGLKGKLTVLPEIFDTMNFTLLINKSSPYVGILPKFDRTIREMRESGAIQSIVQANRER